MALMRRLLAARRERAESGKVRKWRWDRERARKREKERGTERGTGGHQKLEEEAESERSESEGGRYGEEEVVALTRGGGKWMMLAGV